MNGLYSFAVADLDYQCCQTTLQSKIILRILNIVLMKFWFEITRIPVMLVSSHLKGFGLF